MKSLVLVLNCGSSSVKAAVIDNVTGEVLISCLAERLNFPDAYITFKRQGQKEELDLASAPHHTGAVEALMKKLGELDLLDKIGAVGHRIVHGGDLFTESCIVDDKVIDNLEKKCNVLAPLHTPAHLLGLRAAMKVFRHVPHVTVFDTAFHQTIPQYAYIYALPYELYEEYHVRRYGAHGTSHRYCAMEAARLLGRSVENMALVICHLGNGASVAAVLNGRCRDTSMGLTPLEGLVMGTRSGDVDPSIYNFLSENAGMNIDQIYHMLNKESGLLGVSGVSNDFRTVEEAAKTGQPRAQLAIEIFCYRLAKYIAAMTVANGHLDAIVFTGGIGENAKDMRATVLNHLRFMGLQVDDQLNSEMRFGKAGIITKSINPLAMVIPTNEELMIARDAARLAGLEGPASI